MPDNVKRFEVEDLETGKLLVFHDSGTEHWGPVQESEGWSAYDDCPEYFVEETLYRHSSGEWTLVREKTHFEVAFPLTPEARRLSDADAAGWLVRHGFEAPPDIGFLAAGSFFVPDPVKASVQGGRAVGPPDIAKPARTTSDPVVTPDQLAAGVENGAPGRTADSRTDSPRKRGAVVPENVDVAKLAKKIKRELPKGGTMIDIARDSTNSDEKRAQSLLRQLRGGRFKHLLE